MDSNNSPRLSKTGNLAWAIGFSILVCVLLYTALIYLGGVWNFIANTRLLDLMIKGGLVKYHDKDAGFIDGVADLKYYLQSQDPVRWDLAFVVLLIFLVFFAVKAAQFHGFARLFGIRGDFARNLRTFSFGLFVEKVFSFDIGDVALAKNLQDEGAPLDRAKAVTFAANAFIAFEIVVFALIGLPFMGWGAWLGQMFGSLVIFVVAYAFVRSLRPLPASDGKSISENAKILWRVLVSQPKNAFWLAFLSLLAFALEDIAAYFVAMSFTGENVILKVNFAVLLMGVVASYIARFVRTTPGGLGQFEWGFAAGLYLGGVGFPESVTIAVLDNVFRYASAGIFYFFTTRHTTVSTSIGSVLNVFRRGADEAEPSGIAAPVIEEGAPAEIPAVPLPRVLPASVLWKRGLITFAVVLCLFYLDQLTLLITDYWLLGSLGYISVFWTNFICGASMFAFGFLTMGFGVAYPAYTNHLERGQKRFVLGLATLAGSIGGYFLSLTYLNILLSIGKAFGRRDPIFDLDAAIYVCSLPSIWVFWNALMWGTALGFVSAIGCGYAAHLNKGGGDAGRERGLGRLVRVLGTIATRTTYFSLASVGVILAAGMWLTRYSIMLKDNTPNGIFIGASYIDVVGFFTNLNYITVTTVAILIITAGLIVILRACRDAVQGAEPAAWRSRLLLGGQIVLLLVLIDFGFKAAVVIRDAVAVTPNNPVINLPWIAQHIKWSRDGYQLNKFKEVQFVPKDVGDPLPDVNKLLADAAVKNAPLWPGFTSYLERYIDPQHGKRILQTKGDKMVYGPTMEVFRQQQKLRTYYDFLGIDTVRYRINGEKKMFVSAVRELPLLEPVPWLGWFGQRYMLFTHGFGVAIAPVAQSGVEGGPQFVSYNIPTVAKYPEIKVKNDRIYYGEGAATIAYSNINQMKEFDYPTDQDRAELWLPEDINAGIKMDSILKRLVFGYRSGQFFIVVFSRLITDETRVHFWRTPIERLERVAPFLYYDSNPYAVVVDGKIEWLVNALTTSDRYPFSRIRRIGDKSDERSRFPRPKRWMNYAEDSVKATVDAATGMVRFYQIADEPLVNTWAWIYPKLFTPAKEMPQGVRAQLTYPVQWFHTQIDDAYLYYHMNEPMYYFNMEDMWDDGDEVLGPIIDSGHAIRFSIEPFYVMVETGKGGVPAAASGDQAQFALAALYTPEKALNLRGIPIAFQDPGNYGQVVILGVPKGIYSIGPEQADSAIDQEPHISEQISWWNRRGNDVIRGHTTALLVAGEVIYVEPIFIRSQQNPVTQMKRVVAVFRGVARMGGTLEEALRLAVAGYKEKYGAAGLTTKAQKAAAPGSTK